MNKRRFLAFLAVSALVASHPFAITQQTATQHTLFEVSLDRAMQRPVSGRLIVFMERADLAKAEAHDGQATQLDVDFLSPKNVAITAKEVRTLTPGSAVAVDADDVAFPVGFSHLPDGDYVMQALLDVDHTYNYLGRATGDIVSDVVSTHKSGAGFSPPPALMLRNVISGEEAWNFGPHPPPSLAEARAATKDIDFVSPVLTGFWGRPIHMRGWVVLPPEYEHGSNERYPTVFLTHGFGANQARLTHTAANIYDRMLNKKMPSMIWVLLDESSATGTHEFADSVNNGPWGQALTTELIPYLESQYRMDGKPSGRFLTGHSSGGWATLWVQTHYPKIFGGTWSTSPDPSDFHDFTGVDLYAPHANLYHRADGTAYPLVRDKGEVRATMEEFAHTEEVLGGYGGQFASFDWVFSPRAPDGRPMEMFNRETGDVDPAVVSYWRDHYDIAHYLQANWPALKPDLDGKIHVIVGTADTFYLDGAAHKLQGVLDGLHAKSSFRFLEGRTHMDLYRVGDDPRALEDTIAWEMYAIARPGLVRPASSAR